MMRIIAALVLVACAVLAGYTILHKNIPFIPGSKEFIETKVLPREEKITSIDIENLRVFGDYENVKIASLAELFHSVYPEVTIQGKYDIDPLKGTDFVRYDVQLRFKRSRTLAEHQNTEQKKNEILGMLTKATAQLFSIHSEDPGIGENLLNSMTILLTLGYVSTGGEQNKNKPGRFFSINPWIQEEAIREVYVFNRQDIKEFLEEKDPRRWSLYVRVKGYVLSLVNTGSIATPQPAGPNANEEKK